MKNKICISIIVCLFSMLFTSFTFATTNMKNDAKEMMNSGRNMMMDAGNAIQDTGRTIENKTEEGIDYINNKTKDGIQDMKNTTTDVMDNIKNTTMDDDMREPNNYTTTRTATSTDVNSSIFNSVWTWLIMAIIGIAIIGLIMYYFRQNSITTYNNIDDNNSQK